MDLQKDLAKAQKWYDEEQYERAEKLLTRLLLAYPDEPQLYQVHAMIMLAMGDMQRGIMDLSIAMSLEPDELSNYFTRSSILCELGEFQMALPDCNTIVRTAPQDALGYVSRAICYGGLGQVKKAVADTDKALTLTNDPKKMATIYQLRGSIYCLLYTSPSPRD